jgi:hypothetical protein
MPVEKAMIVNMFFTGTSDKNCSKLPVSIFYEYSYWFFKEILAFKLLTKGKVHTFKAYRFIKFKIA